ncbi:uncharacterized protein N7459_009927 [Penicillium hispanicum]|uniref:uncharacterized protein n=1 Tax=Penicillium hispanicum TaxID=1080232 RepID=UPI00254249A8|nr:uncharacterized protein N7459_009927 [Penicillium hispanicum]KAJ5570497.1 hypothetical protein N7459_009927 [Penicillium hispanicum]
MGRDPAAVTEVSGVHTPDGERLQVTRKGKQEDTRDLRKMGPGKSRKVLMMLQPLLRAACTLALGAAAGPSNDAGRMQVSQISSGLGAMVGLALDRSVGSGMGTRAQLDWVAAGWSLWIPKRISSAEPQVPPGRERPLPRDSKHQENVEN